MGWDGMVLMLYDQPILLLLHPGTKGVRGENRLALFGHPPYKLKPPARPWRCKGLPILGWGGCPERPRAGVGCEGKGVHLV
jgi:hypothetical protein